MKVVKIFLLFFIFAGIAHAQMIKRTDAIWARSVPRGTITVDGKLNEAAWAVAESAQVSYGNNSSIPGSGYKLEFGVPPTDSTRATVKFLVSGDSLYVAVWVPDSSIGGGLFNKGDALLMNLRDHAVPDRPAPPYEYIYGWITESWGNPSTGNVGSPPAFMGKAGTDHTLWNGACTVKGVTNDDTNPDTGWVAELVFNLNARGYHPQNAEGDIAEFNISIYDGDWGWPFNASKFSGNRTWFQGPWGNASSYNLARIHMRPDVTISSGAVPVIAPEVIIPNGANYPTPVIDGQLDEAVWRQAPHFDIRYGDDALRATYPSVGPYRSGQYQPTVNGGQAAVNDPGDATIYYFVKGDTLYIAADVRDKVVVSNANLDLWDALRVTIDDRKATAVNDDHVHLGRDLIVRIDSLGQTIADGYLPFLEDSLHGAKAALKLKGGTTLNDPSDLDSGYVIEMAVDLTKLGYPADLGDRVMFLGVTLYDGDIFANASDTYGERTWWFREYGGPAGPAWCYMDPTTFVTGVKDGRNNQIPDEFTILGNYPNPFNPSTKIQFNMPDAGNVTLQVYDVLGRSIASQNLGFHQAGQQQASFNAGNLSSGVYLYRLQMTNSSSVKTRSTMFQKMVLVK